MLQENCGKTPTRQAVRIRVVVAKTGLAKSTIHSLVKAGKFPRPFRLVEGGRASGWWLSDVEAYLDERSAASLEVR